jgi:hypothetical protein
MFPMLLSFLRFFRFLVGYTKRRLPHEQEFAMDRLQTLGKLRGALKHPEPRYVQFTRYPLGMVNDDHVKSQAFDTHAWQSVLSVAKLRLIHSVVQVYGRVELHRQTDNTPASSSEIRTVTFRMPMTSLQHLALLQTANPSLKSCLRA